jgi:hypothetical protein
MPTMAERTVSANDVEQRGGLTAAETEAFISAPRTASASTRWT